MRSIVRPAALVVAFVLVNAGAPARAVPTPPMPALTAPIPDSAEIVYFFSGHIYVMDAQGRHETQITFGSPPVRFWEHVAVSHDRRFVVGNEHRSPIEPVPGGLSTLVLFDLEEGTQRYLTPDFQSAGNGGVTWDRKGFVYFAGRQAGPGNAGPGDLFGAGANDIYKIRWDGTGLERLTNTPDRGEGDIGISADGKTIAWVAQPIGSNHTELWTARPDGTHARLAYRAGEIGVASAHDPEPSDDGRLLAFSIPNPDVPPNFCQYPWACTAHDIYVMDLRTKAVRRVTKPGPISIAPNWKGSRLLYSEMNERRNYLGAAIVDGRGTDQEPVRIRHDASGPKWIP